jgi:hypothetical protein
MKKLIVVTALLLTSVLPASAETVRTCSSVYGGGEVCGENTTTVVTEHNIIETKTGANDNQMIKLLLSIAGAAALATGLYKLTYRSYILG